MVNNRLIIFLPLIYLGLITPAFTQNFNASSSKGINKTQVKLSLQDAIRITLKNNVSIAVQEYFSKIRAQEITREEALFDPSVSAEISADRTDSQVASAFASPNISQNENKKWELSLSQKLLTGADYEINFTNRKNNTNSAFAGLNPQYNSELSLTLTQPLLKNFGLPINKTNIMIASNNRNISDYEFKDKVIQTLAGVESN